MSIRGLFPIVPQVEKSKMNVPVVLWWLVSLSFSYGKGTRWLSESHSMMTLVLSHLPKALFQWLILRRQRQNNKTIGSRERGNIPWGCCIIFFWGDVKKCPLTPDKALMTDKCNSSFHSCSNLHTSGFPGVLTEVWMSSYLQEHIKFKGSCIAAKLTPTWVTIQKSCTPKISEEFVGSSTG